MASSEDDGSDMAKVDGCDGEAEGESKKKCACPCD
jgi:hypothetical protein